MFTRILYTAAAVLAVLPFAATLASADTITAKVRAWVPASQQLILDSGEVFPIDPAKTAVPEPLLPGDTITIDFRSDDNGVTAIYAVTKVQG